MLVLQMKPMENVCVDQTRLDALYRQLGEADAEDILCRALEDIALRLSHCSDLYHDKKLVELRKNTRTLIAVGDQIGMLAMTRVATDVVTCIDRGIRLPPPPRFRACCGLASDRFAQSGTATKTRADGLRASLERIGCAAGCSEIESVPCPAPLSRKPPIPCRCTFFPKMR
ncbi:hypothetical protein ACFQFQ_19945 [Sulfitobacter porphyrae]|uniref:Uncharacterized protein n=1 Tax=Sulfitobacter porphyrae TaxID=1246864 RepID=A0ABW2B7N9_9RHOB